MKYRHLFFDLDGTLWDLKRNTRIALETLFDSFKERFEGVSFDHFFSRYHHHNDHVWALYRNGRIEKEDLRVVRFSSTFRDCAVPDDQVFTTEFADAFLDLCPRQPHLLEGALDILDYARQHYSLHIITNGFQEVQGIKMQASGLKGYFLQVIHSEEAGVRKPHPGIFNYALRLTGARAEDSLMIGDDWEADILGARDVGIDQVFLTTTEEMLQSMSGVSGNVMARHNYQPTHTIGALADLREII